MREEDFVELKFRLYDGLNIEPHPVRFQLHGGNAEGEDSLRLVKGIITLVANDVKLISSGKFLENHKTVARCKPPFIELLERIITMHVVVQPSSPKIKPVEAFRVNIVLDDLVVNLAILVSGA